MRLWRTGDPRLDRRKVSTSLGLHVLLCKGNFLRRRNFDQKRHCYACCIVEQRFLRRAQNVILCMSVYEHVDRRTASQEDDHPKARSNINTFLIHSFNMKPGED